MPVKHAYYKYCLLAMAVAFGIEFPRFFEFQTVVTRNTETGPVIVKDPSDNDGDTTVSYWTTNLMEDTIYIR